MTIPGTDGCGGREAMTTKGASIRLLMREDSAGDIYITGYFTSMAFTNNKIAVSAPVIFDLVDEVFLEPVLDTEVRLFERFIMIQQGKQVMVGTLSFGKLVLSRVIE